MKALVVVSAAGVIAALWYLAGASATQPTEPAQLPGVARRATPTSLQAPPRDQPTLAPSQGAEIEPPPAAAPAPPSHGLEEQRALLERAFADQAVDPAWASGARATLVGDLGRFTGAQAHLGEVQCRQSLCRVELLLDREEAGGELVRAWLRDRRWDGPGSALPERTAAGAHRLILFVGRIDASFPQL